ncbi:MAG: glycerol-3-phosphate 1-O-acyltransferase PlsY [Rhodocyclaceae bacterium]|nr:MAG: glycerol-3-phosphate 1-O-acyltransferase PlsY [Rhodocyclaceae bacterium]
MTTAIFVVLGYLLGSLPFAVIVSRAFGLADPRSYGSGNPGATNVLRSGNKAAAVLTLAGDAAKGWLAVWLAARFGAEETALASIGLAAFLGHVFPLFLGFKGGKGVATAVGVLLGLHWILALAATLTWLLVVLVTRYSSLSALLAAVEAPFVAWILSDRADIALPVAVMSMLLIWRHAANIRKLLAGTESKIGKK